MGEIADRCADECNDMNDEVRSTYPLEHDWVPNKDDEYQVEVHPEWKQLVAELAHARCMQRSMEFEEDYESLFDDMVAEAQFAADPKYASPPTGADKEELEGLLRAERRRISDADMEGHDEMEMEHLHNLTVLEPIVRDTVRALVTLEQQRKGLPDWSDLLRDTSPLAAALRTVQDALLAALSNHLFTDLYQWDRFFDAAGAPGYGLRLTGTDTGARTLGKLAFVRFTNPARTKWAVCSSFVTGQSNGESNASPG